MSKPEDQGICIFAYNNDQLDYTQFAIIAASYAKRNMDNISVTLITDDGTQEWMRNNIDWALIDRCFNHIVLDNTEQKKNYRKHMDSPWTEFNAQFNNSNKHLVFDLTPYEKTLLIDVDFLIMNDFYQYLFDTDEPVAMHRYAQYIGGDMPYRNEITLNDAGVNHWWSTVVYFDQSEESKLFFDTWAHVKEHWEYYSLLYQFPKMLFRTDFCVSIASHLMNGCNNDSWIHDFQNQPLLNMDQKDDIIEMNSVQDFVFLKHDRAEQWKNYLVRHTDQNLHIMNKRALARYYENIMERLKNE